MANKRKISCLPCRLKKVKCNGQKPCQRCQKKDTTCTFQKPGSVGRPPKNAVVNKLVLSKNTTTTTKSFCQQFIFEHISLTPVLLPTRYIQDSKQMSLSHHLNSLFAFYFKNNSTTKRLSHHGEYTHVSPKVKIYNLAHYFTSLTEDMANILTCRISKLKLTYYSNLEFSNTALAYDRATSFFQPPIPHIVSPNPLNALPPTQAISLIETFFSIHPLSFLLNKTMLLQSYWTDTIDPLLLTVIYGTTTFKSQLLQGKPLELWGELNKTKRNPFLDYAHHLLSKASAETTPSRYQAIVLLGLFEITFGFPKKGMSLLGLSFMMATNLGLFDNTMPSGLNQVEKELLLVTFWAAFEDTIRGCVELEQIPRLALTYHTQLLPPANATLSKSYQHDIENNNTRSFKNHNHLIETFYIRAVIAKISCQLIIQLPVKQDSSTETTTGLNLLKEPNEDIETGMERILKGFEYLILENRASLSLLQEYTLELYRLFYTICLRFKRSSLKTLQFSLHQRHLPTLLDLTDINNLIDIHQVLPDAITVIQNTLNYLSTTKPTDNYEEYKSILPRGIIISALDAAAQVLMYAYQLEPSEQIRSYLDLTLNILSEDSIWYDWGTADILKRAIHDFLSQHLPSIISESSSSFDWLIPPSIPYSIEENRPWIQDILTTDVLSIESFFDGLLF